MNDIRNGNMVKDHLQIVWEKHLLRKDLRKL